MSHENDQKTSDQYTGDATAALPAEVLGELDTAGTAAAEAGVKAVVQPGGSKRDQEVIAAADEAGVAMVLTGMRHFRH